jgi:dTDP-4-amino-4,6-dideoxygalactose transaminase
MLGALRGPVEMDVYGPLQDAVYWRNCQELASHLPEGVAVRYRGVAQPEEVPQLLADYDLLLFPTRGESFGHVVLEVAPRRRPGPHQRPDAVAWSGGNGRRVGPPAGPAGGVGGGAGALPHVGRGGVERVVGPGAPGGVRVRPRRGRALHEPGAAPRRHRSPPVRSPRRRVSPHATYDAPPVECRSMSDPAPRPVRDRFLAFSPPAVGEDEVEAVAAALRTGWLSTGPRVAELERRLSAYLDRPEALAVSSCSAGLHLALLSLGIGEGDEVVLPSLTFTATANAVEHVGARAVFVDVAPETLNLDPGALRAAIRRPGQRLRAVIPVHLYGHPCELDEIRSLAAEAGIAVVEDAAHAIGARYRGRRIGEADPRHPAGAAAFSFYANKNLTTGEGGLLVGPPELLREARLWSSNGIDRTPYGRYEAGGSWYYEVVRPGYKYNLTDLAAAIGLRQLDRFEGFQSRRRAVAAAYTRAFAGNALLQPPAERPEVEHAWHVYALRLRLDHLRGTRNDFIEAMRARNIGTSVHFIPLHLQPYYRDRYGLRPEDFPVADAEFPRLVSLPIHPGLTDGDVADVVHAVLDTAEALRV